MFPETARLLKLATASLGDLSPDNCSPHLHCSLTLWLQAEDNTTNNSYHMDFNFLNIHMTAASSLSEIVCLPRAIDEAAVLDKAAAAATAVAGCCA